MILTDSKKYAEDLMYKIIRTHYEYKIDLNASIIKKVYQYKYNSYNNFKRIQTLIFKLNITPKEATKALRDLVVMSHTEITKYLMLKGGSPDIDSVNTVISNMKYMGSIGISDKILEDNIKFLTVYLEGRIHDNK